MGNIKAINIKDTFGKATDEAIRKAIEAVKSERAEIVVLDKKPGRPTKYSEKLCKLLPYLFANGESVSEVCVHLDITKETFFQWVKQYPEFSDSYKKGQELSEAWWVRTGRLGSIGHIKNLQPATWIFNMKNRFGWKDRQDVQLSGDISVADMPPEERKRKLEEILKKANDQS
jgi:transposase